MNKRTLGKTAIEVSKIAFGGVSIGLPYGIGVETQADMPSEDYSIKLLRTAVQKGVNFFDTARAYGKSEEVMGRAFEDIRSDVVICTKPDHFPDDSTCDISTHINTSLEKSLKVLQTDYVDILMSHDGKLEFLRDEKFISVFDDIKQQGLARTLGVSVYTVNESIEAVNSGIWDVIQLPFNLMDQRQGQVFALAKEKGVSIVVRSVLFKGILTDRGRELHPELESIVRHRGLYDQFLDKDAETLSELATRFVLSQDGVTSILVGIDKLEYLDKAIEAVEKGDLKEDVLQKTSQTQYPEPDFLDLAKWDRKGWLT